MSILTYVRNLGIETDIYLSVITGGEPGETISHRVALASSNGSTAACFVCRWLSLLVEHDHCDKVLANISTKPDAALRALLLLLPAWIIIIGGPYWFIGYLLGKQIG